MNDKVVKEHFTIKECEEKMEYKSFEIRVAKEKGEDFEDMEKELEEMKNEYKELTDKDWDTTTYYLANITWISNCLLGSKLQNESLHCFYWMFLYQMCYFFL